MRVSRVAGRSAAGDDLGMTEVKLQYWTAPVAVKNPYAHGALFCQRMEHVLNELSDGRRAEAAVTSAIEAVLRLCKNGRVDEIATYKDLSFGESLWSLLRLH